MFQRPQQKDMFSQNFFIVFFLFLFIALIIVVYLTFFSDITESPFVKTILQKTGLIKEKIDITELEQKSYVINIKTNVKSEVPYKIFLNNTEVYNAIFKPDTIEIYNNAKYNQTYTIKGQSDKYYYKEQDCFIFTDVECDVYFKEKAQHIAIILTENNLQIIPINGIIQNPLVCITWYQNTEFIKIPELQQTYIPQRLNKFLDVCYSFNKDISETINLQIKVQKLSINKDNVQFWVIDKEIFSNSNVLTYDEDTGIPDKTQTIII